MESSVWNDNYYFDITITVNLVQPDAFLFYPKSVLPSSCPVYPLSATLEKVLCSVSCFPLSLPACCISVLLGRGLCPCLLGTSWF